MSDTHLPNSVLPNLTTPAADIMIIGMGAGDIGDLSLAGWHVLHRAHSIYLRTERHPAVAQFPGTISFQSFDHLYEAHDKFADVYAEIANQIVASAQTLRQADQNAQGIVYVVPGHPWVGEMTTPLIIEQARASELSVTVLGGSSFIEPSFAAVEIDAMNGSQIVDGMLLAQQHYPQIEPTLPLLIGQVYARWLASDIKLTLLNAYPPEHSVTLIQAAGSAVERTKAVALHELDHRDGFGHLTSLYVPPVAAYGGFSALQEIVAHLRAPKGCPWDQEQTLQTLRHDLLSECAEVMEAIDAEADGSDNTDHIAEELGDLLLTPAMMIQIAAEEGRFQMADVTRGIVEKLIRRHPHVFADQSVAGVDEVYANWDEIKAQERAAKGEAPRGLLDGVSAALPALEKACELQSKAAKAGLFDRQQAAEAVQDQLANFHEQPTEESLGALLWNIVAMAKESGVNAEDALRAHGVRFRAQHG